MQCCIIDHICRRYQPLILSHALTKCIDIIFIEYRTNFYTCQRCTLRASSLNSNSLLVYLINYSLIKIDKLLKLFKSTFSKQSLKFF